MKKLIFPIALAALLIASCDNKKTEGETEGQNDSIAMADSIAALDTASHIDIVKHIEKLEPNTKTIDSLLKKPVTTPANNPFGLRVGDKVLTGLAKDPLKSRMQSILGDKYTDYVKYLTTAKPLKKDSDGFLHTQGAASKGSKNEAFFLYHHENDVLFVGYQKGAERLMLNDMKSRMFAPQSVDDWVERPVVE